VSENGKQIAVQAALGHIVDASSGLSRELAMIAATSLQAGWLTANERAALLDLSCAFERLSVAGCPS